jgi:hypothetical protein
MIANSQRTCGVRGIHGAIHRRIVERRLVCLAVQNETHVNRLEQPIKTRCFQADRSRRDVELPPDHHQRVSLAHQIAVAEIGGRHRIDRARRAIESCQESDASSVDHLEQQDTVASCRIHRSQDHKVGCEVNTTVSCPVGTIEIDDAPVLRIEGIESELDRASQLLV